MTTYKASVRIPPGVLPGICACLTLVFLYLKASGHVDMSWWWVFSPLWIPIALFVSFYIFIVLVVCLEALFHD